MKKQVDASSYTIPRDTTRDLGISKNTVLDIMKRHRGQTL